MKRYSVLYTILAAFLLTLVFISSSIYPSFGNPPLQGNATELQQTIDSLVSARFTQTAQVGLDATVNARMNQLLTATAKASLGKSTATPNIGGQTDPCLVNNPLRVASDTSYPPFESIDQTNKIVGFDVDVLNGIAQSQSLKVAITSEPFDTIFTRLASGKYDLLISGATITSERSKTVSFSKPYFLNNQVLVARQDDATTRKTLNALQGLTIGVQSGTVGESFAKSSVSGANIQPFSTPFDTLTALADTTVDAVIIDLPSAAATIADNPQLNVVITASGFAPESYGIAVRKECPVLLAKVNAGLDAIIASGLYSQTYRKYFAIDAPAQFLPKGGSNVKATATPLVRTPTDLTSRTLLGHKGQVYSLAFSPDGTRILSGGEDKTAILWDAQTGTILRTITTHTGWVSSVAFSPDGKYYLTGSADRTAILWNAATGARVRTLTAHTDVVRGVAFSPDSKTMATASWDKRVILWDVATGQQIRTLNGHSTFVIGVKFSPDGKYLLSGSYDTTAVLWDLETGDKLFTFKQASAIYGVAFSPDSQTVLTSGQDLSAVQWSTSTGEKLQTFQGKSSIFGVAFTLDGKTIFTTNGAASTSAVAAIQWNLETGAVIKNFTGQSGIVYGIAVSPDGKSLITGSNDGSIRVWSIE